MLDALEGLNYMHTFPVPIPQGDLTPVWRVLSLLDYAY